MGQSLTYQAIPTGSRLYACVRIDPAAGAVFGHLLMHGGNIWGWSGESARRQRQELAEVLDELVEWPLLGSRAAVDRAVRTLSVALDEVRTRHPGWSGGERSSERHSWMSSRGWQPTSVARSIRTPLVWRGWWCSAPTTWPLLA